MRLTSLRRLYGPNIYTARPVTVARLDLEELAGQETTGIEGFAARLLALLPGLADHHCAAGEPGGFCHAMARGTYFGHVTEHVALELSALAGRDVYFGRTAWAGAGGRYDVVMECPQDEPVDSAVPGDLLRLAIGVVTDVIAERSPGLAEAIAPIAAEAERASTGPGAAAGRPRALPVIRERRVPAGPCPAHRACWGGTAPRARWG